MLPLWTQGHPYLLVQLYQYYTLSWLKFLTYAVFSSVTIFVQPCFQTIVAQINHAIGAAGIVSIECKTVMYKYGNMIWEYLIEGVRCP